MHQPQPADHGPATYTRPSVEDSVQHLPQRVLTRDVHHHVFGASGVAHLNASIAIAATRVLGSMWFFWFCVLLDLVELPAVLRTPSPIVVVTYVSQTVIQLLALPLIGAGQRIIAAAQDARADADHKTLTALHTINVNQLEILRRLEKLEEARTKA